MPTSAYFPPGLDKEKLLQASSEDLLKLSDDDRTAMLDSLKATLGPEGYKALLQEMSNNYKAFMVAKEKASSPNPNDELPPEIRALFLATLKWLCPGELGGGEIGVCGVSDDVWRGREVGYLTAALGPNYC